MRTVLPTTGLLSPRPFVDRRGRPAGPPRRVYVGKRLYPAQQNFDRPLPATLAGFPVDEWPFLERQIVRSARPPWATQSVDGEPAQHVSGWPVLDEPWTVSDEALQGFLADGSGPVGHYILLGTPLLASDRALALLAGQRSEPGRAEDFTLLLAREGTRWAVRA